MKLSHTTLVLLIFTLSFTSAMAQKKEARFGLSFGGNLSNINQDFSENISDLELDTKSNLTYQIGFKVDNSINENFSIQPTFLFNRKGFRIDEYEQNGSRFAAYNLSYNYIEVSIDFLAKLDNGMFFSAAPYFAYGINGKIKFDEPDGITIPDIKLTGKIGESTVQGQFEGIYNAPDAGLIFGTGFQKNVFQFKLGYSVGLNNTTPKTPNADRDDTKVFNRVLSTSITLFFD